MRTVLCIIQWGGGDAITPARYLTFRAGSDNSSFGLKTIATDHKVYYSKDLRDWKLFDTEENVAINNGEEVYVIGDADGVTSFGTNNATTFRMAGSISVTGDITSILDYKTLDEKIEPYCYNTMFYGCTSLTQAPALPATTLDSGCYAGMFRNCRELTQAPELPATTLGNGCYNGMFYGCTNLSSITCLATNISALFSTTNWLYDVATTGTFTKAASMTSWPSGPSGIPNGWTVVNYTTNSEDVDPVTPPGQEL